MWVCTKAKAKAKKRPRRCCFPTVLLPHLLWVTKIVSVCLCVCPSGHHHHTGGCLRPAYFFLCPPVPAKEIARTRYYLRGRAKQSRGGCARSAVSRHGLLCEPAELLRARGDGESVARQPAGRTPRAWPGTLYWGYYCTVYTLLLLVLQYYYVVEPTVLYRANIHIIGVKHVSSFFICRGG